MNVTVGGLPGTGTSTLCRLLAPRLGLPYIYAGQIFRDEAAARGLDLGSFGRLCEDDPTVDQALDEKQMDILRAQSVLLEGRLSGWLAHRNQIPAFKVWITCDPVERVKRVVQREGGDIEAQARAMATRERSEADRYARYYGIDLQDTSIYDMVLDSTRQGPDALAHQVLARLHAGIS